ncbi:MAG: hypothetical protein JW764_02665 [Chlorobiaceae bacterium]|nr:hypothetical protein [Chlorobiaceae bacterium]
MNTSPVFDSGTLTLTPGKISMHCDTWDPDKPSSRTGKISMHCDTWTPDEPSKRTGKISMHCDTWVPEPEEGDAK